MPMLDIYQISEVGSGRKVYCYNDLPKSRPKVSVIQGF